MIHKPEKTALIVKYALLLTIIYAVQMMLRYFYKFALHELANNFQNLLKSFVPFIMAVVGNLIALYFVLKDKNRFNLKNKYLGWLTFFYCPVGVCVLLIHVIIGNSNVDKVLDE